MMIGFCEIEFFSPGNGKMWMREEILNVVILSGNGALTELHCEYF